MALREMIEQSAPVAAKNIPTAVAPTLTIAGYHVPDVVYMLTVIWLLMQMAGWLYDRFKKKE
jgi:hypothetical protein